MQVNSKYKTPTGELYHVTIVDDINKMVCVKLSETKNQWFHEKDYETWTAIDDLPKIYVPDVPAQMIEETEEKPKRKTTKKEKE